MRVTFGLSIKAKTYLLVLLSAISALLLSIVASSGLEHLRVEMNDLVFSTKIERYTHKLILEEQRYRLNTNSSVYDIEVANKAYDSALAYANKIYAILETVEGLPESHLIAENMQNIRHSTDEYKTLYLRGVSRLTTLNKQADILEIEGEYITQQIQNYVEAKREDIKKELSQKTIEKINNGSNIWQYTYVTRLHEKKYRLSPDVIVFADFKKDFQFMMSEWQRLKAMSDQKFERETLKKFNLSALRYKAAMQVWVSANEQLVLEILPKMKRLGEGVVSHTIKQAEQSVHRTSTERNRVGLTLLLVSMAIIILGLVFGAAIARSISTVVSSFQSGLLHFFQYLNQQQKTVEPIVVHGRDEISVMASVVNENIIRLQKVLDRKAGYQQALLAWSKVDYQDYRATLSKATELSAKSLHVERVSVWLFNDSFSELRCADLYEYDEKKHSSGFVIKAIDYPEYFTFVSSGKALVANDARSDSRTCAFNDAYFKPLDIYSLLDLPIFQGEKLLGLIRYEKTAEFKVWERDEQEFSGSMINAISLSLEIKKRNLLQEELKEQKEIFHYHAHHDSLTGLPNRFLFDDRLSQAVKLAQRHDTKIAVLFLDLDHFKRVNDSMGHKVGDELLIEVARRLQAEIRASDTLARLGGDEFAIVIGDVEDIDGVVGLTQDLLRAMEPAIELSSQSFFVTLSVGVVIGPDDGVAADELLKHADTAMYQAKEEGRNTYQFYTQSMTEKAFERVAMETNFRNALSREEFVVHYQPQVDTKTGKFVGMEALIRWIHPEMGQLSPAAFLSFANDSGLVIPMDQWVMKTAMTKIVQWYKEGLEPGVLAVNISMCQLQRADFVETIAELLSQTGCLPEWLELEVTESHIMEDASVVIQVLTKIKALGVSLAIDDFGAGYSSLSQLKQLPINKLKIDRSFIRDLPHNEEDAVITKMVIGLSHSMGLEVLAEGVETEEQNDFLLENGCHYIQGYFYAKPMLAADFEKRLRAQAE
jgi:diguanylate cyclase (GGDEF)-like protein